MESRRCPEAEPWHPVGLRYSNAAIQLNHVFFFSSRRRHTRGGRDWSSDVCSSDLRRQRRRGDDAAAAARCHLAPELVGEEIGRASCRERGVDLGGRRIIKKKKRKKKTKIYQTKQNKKNKNEKQLNKTRP